MKILFVIPSISKGGQERAGMYLCNFLQRYHEVTVVCFSPPHQADYNYQCPVLRVDIQSKSGLGKALSFFKRISQLKKIKRTISPGVSIAFGNSAIILNHFSGGREKKIASVRQSFSMLVNNRSLNMRLHMKAYVHSLRKADRIVCVSSDLNDELWEYFRIKNHLFINNCADSSMIRDLGKERITVLNPGRKWLSHSGRFDPSKGHGHLIRIFSLVKEVMPGTGLILLGATDHSSSQGLEIYRFCKSFLESRGLSFSENINEDADVIFAGHQQNPFQFISQSDIFLLPSLWEGFPNALLEAMSLGIPVIAADCKTGPSELLIDPGYGILMPPFNEGSSISDEILPLHQAWANKITMILSDKNLAESLSGGAVKRASDFSVDAIGNKWLNLVDTI